MAAPAENRRWVPLSVRNDPERTANFDILHEGIPKWLRDGLVQWIESLSHTPDGFGGRIWSPNTHSFLQASLQVELPHSASQLSSELMLDVIDWILARQNISGSDFFRLEVLLSDGGSAWRATPERLERRVDETLQSVADAVFVTNDRPADYLKSAWHKAWGRNPDASGAHQDAVSATEAAYAPIVSPDNDRATLGTIIGNIRAKPPKYQVRLQTKTAEKDVCRIVDMMELLWESQRRHGTDDRSRETVEEARDAVAIATSLVHLAQQGGFKANGP